MEATECEHDWLESERHEHEYKGRTFWFWTYQCWKCQRWTHGSLHFSDGTIREALLP